MTENITNPKIFVLVFLYNLFSRGIFKNKFNLILKNYYSHFLHSSILTMLKKDKIGVVFVDELMFKIHLVSQYHAVLLQ